jgi:Uma2 family endonuclease
MSEPATRKATYEDLCALPENVVGEIINGELIATPRPSYRHGNAASALAELRGPYQYGRGGPGGWWIVIEPEVHFGQHVLVPDLAGWRRTRMPALPEGNWTDITPDWVCEVVSPNTARMDRVRKMPVYLEFGVPHLWMVDSVNKTLEVFRLQSGGWLLLGSFVEDDKVRAEPFQEIEVELNHLWA